MTSRSLSVLTIAARSVASLALACPAFATTPQNFLYVSSDDLVQAAPLVERADIGGVQVVYSWKSLETAKDVYDFSQIERDLASVEKLHKQLFIQIQDRFFEIQARNIPEYLLQDPAYGGGLVPQSDNPGENKPAGHGWATMQWNPAVQARYQRLLAALAAKFDGRVLGVNLPETAIDIDVKRETSASGFTCEKYFTAELGNLKFARAAFKKSHVVQYVNFWPCEWNNDHKFMSRFFTFAEENRIGVGGPDIVPYNKAQMNNSYPFMHQHRGQIELVAMAVQEPTLTYLNAATKKPFTREEFVDFAENYLGVDIIFWSTTTPWLRQQPAAN